MFHQEKYNHLTILVHVKKITVLIIRRTLCKTWGFHSNEDSSCSLLGEDGGNMVLWNTGTLPHHYSVSQPRTPQVETWSLVTVPSKVTKLLSKAEHDFPWWNFVICVDSKLKTIYIAHVLYTRQLINMQIKRVDLSTFTLDLYSNTQNRSYSTNQNINWIYIQRS
jgi:hypothetical protein